MKEEATRKNNLRWLGGYISSWLLAGIMGFLCWGIMFLFNGMDAPLPEISSYHVGFAFGLLAGITGVTAYFLIWQQLTPIIKWAWYKIKKDARTFSSLV